MFTYNRRITEAEYNYINFKEYLPSIINKDLMDYFDLNVQPLGNYSEYNPNVIPDVINELGVGVLRYSHSTVRNRIPIINKNRVNDSSITLKYNYNKMTELWDGNVIIILIFVIYFAKLWFHLLYLKTNGLLRGLCEDTEEETGFHFSSDLRNFNFFTPCNLRVRDLYSTDIGRGRDHGIAPYIYYVQYCSGIKINSWEDLHQLIPIQTVDKLKGIYK